MTFLPFSSSSEIVPPPLVAAEKPGAASPSFNFNSSSFAINFLTHHVSRFTPHCFGAGELVGCEPNCLTPSITYNSPETPVQTAAPMVQIENHGSPNWTSHLKRIQMI